MDKIQKKRNRNTQNLLRHNSLPSIMRVSVNQDYITQNNLKFSNFINQLLVPNNKKKGINILSTKSFQKWQFNSKRKFQINEPNKHLRSKLTSIQIIHSKTLNNIKKAMKSVSDNKKFSKTRKTDIHKIGTDQINELKNINELLKRKMYPKHKLGPIFLRSNTIVQKTNKRKGSIFHGDSPNTYKSPSTLSKFSFNEKCKHNFQLEEEERKKAEMKRRIKSWKDALLEIYESLKIQHLDTCSNKFFTIFSSNSYAQEKSFEFFNYVKSGNDFEVSNLLRINRFLLYDFDNLKQTPLHWAAKRGNTFLIQLFIKTGVNLNSKDLLTRTPLFLAAKYDKLKAVKILLIGMANPFITSVQGLKPQDISISYQCKRLLQIAEKIFKNFLPFNPFTRRAIFNQINEPLINYYV